MLESSMKPPKVLLVSRVFVVVKGKVLLLHRSKVRNYNPSKWELPGGKVEFGQDINNATEREVLEETGLLVKIISPLTFSEAKIVEDGKYRGMLYLELVNKAKLVAGKIVKVSGDHQGFEWVKMEDVMNFDLSIEARKAITAWLG